MDFRGHQRCRIARNGLIESEREWTADGDTTIHAAILKVLGQQHGAILQLCRRKNRPINDDFAAQSNLDARLNKIKSRAEPVRSKHR
jgi:hypothetical protein